MTPSDLASKIDLCRETAPGLLRQYVDLALEMMRHSTDKAPMMTLAASTLEVGRKRLMPVPEWVSSFLAEAIDLARTNPSIPKTELVIPLLTLYLRTFEPHLQREATRIIRKSYRTLLTTSLPEDRRATLLRTVLTHSDYIPDFDPSKLPTGQIRNSKQSKEHEAKQRTRSKIRNQGHSPNARTRMETNIPHEAK